MMFLHGLGNALITLGAIGVTLWRASRKPTGTSVALGLGATALATYTASLGGKLVYAHGVGVAAEANGTPLLSADAPQKLLRDGLSGLLWLARRAAAALTGRQPLARGSEGLFDTNASAPTGSDAQQRLALAPPS